MDVDWAFLPKNWASFKELEINKGLLSKEFDSFV